MPSNASRAPPTTVAASVVTAGTVPAPTRSIAPVGRRGDLRDLRGVGRGRRTAAIGDDTGDLHEVADDNGVHGAADEDEDAVGGPRG